MNDVDKILQQSLENGYLEDFLLHRGLYLQKSTRYKEFDVDYFKVIDSEEKAYWLGFIYADGWVNFDEEKRRYDFGLCLASKDYDHLMKFAKAIGYKGKIGEIKQNLKGYDKTYVSNRIDLHSKLFVKNLINHGCIQNKSLLLKELPKIPSIHLTPFIRGYFDGDGSVYKARNQYNIEILGTKEFLTDLASYSNLPINAWRTHGKAFGQRYGYKLSKEFLLMIYENSTIHLQRKFERAALFIGNDKLHNPNNG
jgi:intein/homing endonuclease